MLKDINWPQCLLMWAVIKPINVLLCSVRDSQVKEILTFMLVIAGKGNSFTWEVALKRHVRSSSFVINFLCFFSPFQSVKNKF